VTAQEHFIADYRYIEFVRLCTFLFLSYGVGDGVNLRISSGCAGITNSEERRSICCYQLIGKAERCATMSFNAQVWTESSLSPEHAAFQAVTASLMEKDGCPVLWDLLNCTLHFGENVNKQWNVSYLVLIVAGEINPRELTPWSWALLERSLVVRTLDSFPAFHGTRRFNTEFTRALRLSLFWGRPIKSTSPHPTSTTFILILSNHLRLGLPSGLLPSGFPTNNLYRFLFFSIRATCPSHLILLALIILIMRHVVRMGEKRSAYRLIIGKP
jgi:hypothetical protein